MVDPVLSEYLKRPHVPLLIPRGGLRASVSEGNRSKMRAKHARKSFAISPISRRSPQYMNLATSDMTSHGEKELDQHSSKHGVTIVSFICYRHDYGGGFALVGFPRLNVSGSSLTPNQCTWDSEVSRPDSFFFPASRMRKWAKARFASREITYQLCGQPDLNRDVDHLHRLHGVSSLPVPSPPTPLCLSLSQAMNTIAQTTPPRGPPPASSPRAAAAQRTPSRGPWRR